MVQVTLTGSGFSGGGLDFAFDPDKSITVSGFTVVNDTQIIATFVVGSGVKGGVRVRVLRAGRGTGSALFDAGPLDVGGSTNCPGPEDVTKPACNTVRWEVDGDASTVSSKTTPNVVFKLDDQIVSRGRFVSHAIFRTGLTQASVADRIQSSTVLTARQAFLVEAGLTGGVTVARDGSGTFAELGFAGRGAFLALFAGDQVVNGLLDLGSVNPRDAAGLYEGVARFRLAQPHDAGSFDASTGQYKKNVDDLLVIEAGYQNNSALAGLTRNRLVGRFYAYPEIDSKTHTKVLFGVEYNGAMGGGPRDVKVLYGVNLDPAKLMKPDPKQ